MLNILKSLLPTSQPKTGAWLAVAIIFVAGFEGYAAHPYVDKVGTGHPVTWCYGETTADGPAPAFSKVFTKAECQTALGKDLQKYDAQVHSCVKVALPPHREAALVSFTYNLGVGTMCKSKVARYLNAGNVQAGCAAMLAYDHASGVRVAGLTRRRQAEYKMCLQSN